MRSDWVAVIPERGAVKETARALLALARAPQDVRTAAGGAEFLVAPYVADLYNAPAEAPAPRRRAKKEEDS